MLDNELRPQIESSPQSYAGNPTTTITCTWRHISLEGPGEWTQPTQELEFSTKWSAPKPVLSKANHLTICGPAKTVNYSSVHQIPYRWNSNTLAFEMIMKGKFHSNWHQKPGAQVQAYRFTVILNKFFYPLWALFFSHSWGEKVE